MLNKKWANMMLSERKEVTIVRFLLIALSNFSSVSAQNLRLLSDNATCTSCPDGTECCPPNDECMDVPNDMGSYYDCVDHATSKEAQYATQILVGIFGTLCACILLVACAKKCSNLIDNCHAAFQKPKVKTYNEIWSSSLLRNDSNTFSENSPH